MNVKTEVEIKAAWWKVEALNSTKLARIGVCVCVCVCKSNFTWFRISKPRIFLPTKVSLNYPLPVM